MIHFSQENQWFDTFVRLKFFAKIRIRTNFEYNMINFSQENQLLSPDLKYLRSKLGAMAVTILLEPWFWREITTYRKSVFTSGISWFAAIALSKSAPTIWMLFKGLLQDKSLVFSWYSCLDLQWEKNFKLWLKCGFCRKLLLYEYNNNCIFS